MINSGLWLNRPVPDTTAAKTFSKELNKFVESKNYIVKQDKVEIAKQKVN